MYFKPNQKQLRSSKLHYSKGNDKQCLFYISSLEFMRKCVEGPVLTCFAYDKLIQSKVYKRLSCICLWIPTYEF